MILAAVFMVAWRRKQTAPQEPTAETNADEPPRPSPEQHFDEFLQNDRACIEIGVRLISLVDTKRGKGLVERVGNLRTELARKHGIWIPAVRIRDNIHLSPDAYRLMINGREVARAELQVDSLLAIDPGETRASLEGTETTDPAFGLPAKWISANHRPRAELNGYTVVDPATVLITHLGEVLRRYAHELLSREDLRKLLDRVRETSPTIVEDLKPDVIRMGELHQVLVLLLAERVPITNLTRILETIVQIAHKLKNPVDLAEAVRQQLGRDILDRFFNSEGKVVAMVLDPRLEARLRDHLHDQALSLPPEPLERFIGRLNEHWQKAALEGRDMALLADGNLRRPLRQSIARALPELSVIAYHEIPHDVQVDFRSMLKLEEVFPTESTSGQASQLVPEDQLVTTAAA